VEDQDSIAPFRADTPPQRGQDGLEQRVVVDAG
jgi:hypothetical protein